MMEKKIQDAIARLQELAPLLADPHLHKDSKNAAQIIREHTRLSNMLDKHNVILHLQKRIEENMYIIHSESDKELQELAREDNTVLQKKLQQISEELQTLLLPRSAVDEKNAIVEIRAGTGGNEAGLFAADLYRMYSRYAETQGWKVEILSMSEAGIGGMKEVIFSVSGREIFGSLRYESGVHRVQRIPITESAGRIHTSAVTVAVLPEADAADIQLNPEDIRIDVFRSSGPGGQSVNTTDSAVRITHLPSGLIISCQDEKSQHKNKAKALRVLKARLFEQEEQKRMEETAKERRGKIGSGDRSQRIRTYNFPQGRVTDHRIHMTLYKLEQIMQGDLHELLTSVRMQYVEAHA